MNEQGMSAVPQALAASLPRQVSPAACKAWQPCRSRLLKSPPKMATCSAELDRHQGAIARYASPDTVQQLAIHTQGGVVTEAQPLMVIVPSDAPVEVEAMLENKDIGFVRPGQEVEIKVETFTFSKYGVVNGTVTSISNDAIEDEKRGLVYAVRFQLKENSIQVGENRI